MHGLLPWIGLQAQAQFGGRGVVGGVGGRRWHVYSAAVAFELTYTSWSAARKSSNSRRGPSRGRAL